MNYAMRDCKSQSTKYNQRIDYVNEKGQPCYRADIAKEYGVSGAKVKDLFDKYPPYLVYQLISNDRRADNGKRGDKGKVYALPSGEYCTSQEVADYYGISRSSIQRTWVIYGKDSIRSNQYLMDRFFGDQAKV